MGRKDMGLTMIMVKIQNEVIEHTDRQGVKNRSAWLREAATEKMAREQAAKRRKDKRAADAK